MEAPDWVCNLHMQIKQYCVCFVRYKEYSSSNQGHCSFKYGLKAATPLGVGHLKYEFGTLNGKSVLRNASTFLKTSLF
jgi:hypothetical protein